MSWEFRRVRLSGFDHHFPEEWVLAVTDRLQLTEYASLTHPSFVKAAFSEFMNVVEKKSHFKNSHAWAANMLAECHKTNFGDSLFNLFEKVLVCQAQAIKEGKHVALKQNGSWSTLDAYDTLEVRTLEQLTWPDATVVVTKWPGGVHFYAKVGGVDVVMDGEQKWPTKEAAERAAAKFIAGER